MFTSTGQLGLPKSLHPSGTGPGRRANAWVIGLSTYAANILTLLTVATGTDYMVFVLGRYHERRNDGMEREAAFYDMCRGTSHVILGSGLTIATPPRRAFTTRPPAALENATKLGEAYNASDTDDSFYLPPEAFGSPKFQRGHL